MKKQDIENLYINATFNEEAPSVFASKILELNGEDEEKQTRTNLQNRSRWKYLSMVAAILNDKGYGFQAIGIEIELKYTKDLLYHVYWQEMKQTLYPEKKRQLNTGEFCNVADHVMDLFAMVFDVHIPFPNMADYLQQKEAEEERNKEYL